jgi:membrane associated rhomboid family serine protease
MLPIGDEASPRRSFPIITIALIVVNVLVFFNELSGGEAFIIRWSFIPARFISSPSADFITIFTSMFMHAGWLHLGGNMLYLWIFGDNVEDNFGHFKFLAFYILCGLVAAFSQFFFSQNSNIPTLGASGAIAGVLGAYFIMFPRHRVLVLVPIGIVRISAVLVIGFWIVLQAISGLGSLSTASSTGGVAYLAHVGGFVAGFFLSVFFRTRQSTYYYQ